MNVGGILNGLLENVRLQYSKSHLQRNSTQAVIKSEHMINLLGIKYKSKQGGWAKGICCSMV